MSMILLAVVALAAILVGTVFLAICFRIVVPTNSVHIVQTARSRTSYGGSSNRNTYYRWPSWVPVIGVRSTTLPLSVFDEALNNYPAYDKGRVPFVIDIMAFFRIADSNVAAERVHSMEELSEQLKNILQGAARSILATSEIEEILEGRAIFGEKFTQEVAHQLPQWGVEAVKSIELMDIRDATGSEVIENIMAKKKSLIDMQSRVEVAGNAKAAQTAEIEAAREVQMRQQEAQEAVGIRTAEKEQRVGTQTEKAKQAIKEEAKTTAVKDMAVIEVQQVRAAEIQKGVQMVAAEGTKQQTVIVAEGNLSSTKLAAEGIAATGHAKADAEKAMQLAPVQAQITLAKEIGENTGYQTYLISVRQIEAGQAVGIEQAKALSAADIKIISNTGTPSDGIKSVSDLFSARGGQLVGAAIEGLKATEAGAAIVDAVVGNKPKPNGIARA